MSDTEIFAAAPISPAVIADHRPAGLADPAYADGDIRKMYEAVQLRR